MNLKEKILSISKEVSQLDRNDADIKLPQNAYYLSDNKIVCFDRKNGDSRFPYDSDGLVVWARSSGYIEALESTFEIFQTELHNDDPSVGFFTGVPLKNGNYFPVSVFGVSRQLYEPFNVLRYVVYALRSAYYIAETDDFISAVRLHTNEKKDIYFSSITINRKTDDLQIYMSDFFEPWVNYGRFDDFFCRMKRFGKYKDGTYIVSNDGNHIVMKSEISWANPSDEYHTSGRNKFFGVSGRQLLNAESLKTGKIAKQISNVNTTDIPVMSDIFHFNIAGNDSVRIDYKLSYSHNSETADKAFYSVFNAVNIDSELAEQEKREAARLGNLNIKFNDWNGKLNPNVLNRFIKNVQKQVDLCALGKNYAGSLIGIRDVMQQLESCLIWQPEESRKKIIVALNYIMEDGRPPRQFSVPSDENEAPEMDLRKFIDQGNWIISTIYTYLAYTNDYSLLDEKCGYYIPDAENTTVTKSTVSDTVLQHLIKIMDYISANLDKDNTDCLKSLFGDWNDALNGLGKTSDPSKEFGTGVSVMASLHYYQNCREMCEILSEAGGYSDKVFEYTVYGEKIKIGLFKNAVETDENGVKHIIHGWGDKMSYKIGNCKDPDGVNRISSTANSFWVLSGMINNDKSLKKAIIAAFDRLDSKYGFLTFDKPFPLSMEKYVGRIATITEGTYENSAAYVHSSTFAIMALFALGESERAWKSLEKSMVISHDNCTMTPFVMPNSYCHNDNYSIDGESMGDWYTGSGTVLIKGLVKYGFGIAPNLEGVTIQTAKTLPCKNASVNILLKGHPVVLKYTDNSVGIRKIFINGHEATTVFDDLMNISKAYIPNSELTDGMIIEVRD